MARNNAQETLHFPLILSSAGAIAALIPVHIRLSNMTDMTRFDHSLVWLRRDLRLFDQAALHQALLQSRHVYVAFIFDKAILTPLLENGAEDRRVAFIHASLLELDAELKKLGASLIVRHADAADDIPLLAKQLGVQAVFVNHDYEPNAIARDAKVQSALEKDGRVMLSYKDQVIFEKSEVLSLQGKPFSVFTPYKNAWLKKCQTAQGEFDLSLLAPYPTKAQRGQLLPAPSTEKIPALSEMGFAECDLHALKIPTGMEGGQTLLDDFVHRMSQYDETRNFPAVKGPSYLSVHLRFWYGIDTRFS